MVWQGVATGAGPLPGTLALTLALFALWGGTLYQKRHGGGADPRSAQAVQLMASFALVALLALVAVETHVLLGEVMTGRDAAGMALAALGVALVSAKAW